MGEHLLCKQGVVGSNPTVSISFRAEAREVGLDATNEVSAGDGRGLVCCLKGWRHFQSCFVPRWRSGILEREPGGLRDGMFFHMVKMISCVCE